MENNHPFLTICVLAYNQPQSLASTLNSILPQLESGVQILIADDSTNDDTEKMVRAEFNKPYILYFHNEKNLGFDRNIVRISERATGEYIWWMGDDLVEPGTIRQIVEVLRKESPDFSFLNFRFEDWNKGVLDVGPSRMLKDKNEAVEKLANSLGFISSIIFRRQLIDDLTPADFEKFQGTGFVNLFIVLHVLSRSGRIYYFAEPLFVALPTPPGKASYNGFRVFAVNYRKIFRFFIGEFSDSAIRAALSKNFTYVWRGIIVGYLRGYDTPRGKRWTILKLYWSFPGCWLALFLSFVPKPALKLMYDIYRKLRT